MKTILIIIFLFCLKSTSAQVNQEWVATYSGTGSGYNFPKKSAVDKYGNFIVAGNSSNTGGYDYVVLKYSSSGSLIWSQRYNGIGNNYDYVSGMVIDDSGNVYVTGASQEGISLGGINWVTIKYNPNGQMQWKRSLNWTGNNTDEPFGMNIDKERNIYVIGYGKINTVEKALVTIKYNSYGDSIWAVKYSSLPNRSNWGYSVATDDSLNVFSSGYGAVPTGNEILTIKYDSRGNEKWIKRYPTNYGDYLRPTFSAIDSSNNIVVVGYGYFSNNYDFQTIKYSSNGDLMWSRYYAGISDDYANCLTIDNGNNILIGGSAYSTGFSDYLILKYSSDGDTLINKLIEGGSLNSDQVFSILSDNTDNIYVTGFSQSFAGVEHYLTVKLNNSGDTLWTKTYRNAYSNSAYCLNLDQLGNVYVSGAGGLPGDNSGILTIKYSKITGVNLTDDRYLDNFNLYNFPNPFNPNTTINYSLSKTSITEIRIYNIQGIEIQTLIKEIQNIGNYKITFDGKDLSSGIYYYSLFIDSNLKKTRRMLLLK